MNKKYQKANKVLAYFTKKISCFYLSHSRFIYILSILAFSFITFLYSWPGWIWTDTTNVYAQIFNQKFSTHFSFQYPIILSWLYHFGINNPAFYLNHLLFFYFIAQLSFFGIWKNSHNFKSFILFCILILFILHPEVVYSRNFLSRDTVFVLVIAIFTLDMIFEAKKSLFISSLMFGALISVRPEGYLLGSFFVIYILLFNRKYIKYLFISLTPFFFLNSQFFMDQYKISEDKAYEISPIVDSLVFFNKQHPELFDDNDITLIENVSGGEEIKKLNDIVKPFHQHIYYKYTKTCAPCNSGANKRQIKDLYFKFIVNNPKIFLQYRFEMFKHTYSLRKSFDLKTTSYRSYVPSIVNKIKYKANQIIIGEGLLKKNIKIFPLRKFDYVISSIFWYGNLFLCCLIAICFLCIRGRFDLVFILAPFFVTGLVNFLYSPAPYIKYYFSFWYLGIILLTLVMSAKIKGKLKK